MARTLFADDAATQAEVMASAFAAKNVWDHRFFKIKLVLYTTGAIFFTALIGSFLEWLFDFNLFQWLFL